MITRLIIAATSRCVRIPSIATSTTPVQDSSRSRDVIAGLT